MATSASAEFAPGRQKANLEGLLGGLPFLDRAFSAPRLLTAVAALRRWNGGGGGGLRDQLSPAAAQRAARRAGYLPSELDQRTPTAEEMEQIASARSYILALRPDWRDNLALPIEVDVVETDRMFGWSCISTPQYLILGSISFGSVEETAEQFLHELTHNWLYLVQELWPFENGDCEKSFVLPSGTAGKSVTGVLDAAFVMAVLAELYEAAGNAARVAALRQYVRGCVEMLAPRPDLTDMGRQVWARLARV